MISLVPCGTMSNTELKETQVSLGASETISWWCTSAGGTGAVARQTVSQLCSVCLLTCVVRTNRTLAHAGFVWKEAQFISAYSYTYVDSLKNSYLQQFWIDSQMLQNQKKQQKLNCDSTVYHPDGVKHTDTRTVVPKLFCRVFILKKH